MGIPGGANLLLAGGGAGGYEIDNSLLFHGTSETLSRDSWSGTGGNGQSWGTASAWVKNPMQGTRNCVVFGGGYKSGGQSGSNAGLVGASDFKAFYDASYGTNSYQILTSSQVFRDPTAWYHFVWRTGTTSSHYKIWINNVEVISGGNPQWGGWHLMNPGYPSYIGLGGIGEASRGVQIITEVHACYKELYDPTDFGEYNDDGVWVPKEVDVTYGTNGFYLKMDPNATNGVGHDHSGNGNHFTASNFTTAANSLTDSPTNNCGTLNPILNFDGRTPSLTYANLKYSANDQVPYIIGNFPVHTGKYYFEAKPTYRQYSAAYGSVGIYGPEQKTYRAVASDVGRGDGVSSWVYRMDGNKRNNGSSSSYGATWTTNDVIGVALDADAGSITFYKNGTSQGSAYTGLTGPFVVELSASGGTVDFELNCGQKSFAYTPPSGYGGWTTSNIPAPAVKSGEGFNTVLYTGNGSSLAVTGVGFSPDFVWIKDRQSSTQGHHLFDTVRGATKYIKSDTLTSETTDTSSLTSFDSDGFSLGSNGAINNNLNPTVAWNWKAGGSTSTNTSGTITSSVRANTAAGFSIVTYTGNGTDNATVGHGLGQKPDFVIIKNRSNSNTYPFVWHKYFGNEEIIWLSETNSKQTPGTRYIRFGNNTTSVFSLGTNNEANATDIYVAYCFAEVPGFSQFGRFVGSNDSEGPYIYTGFAPAWVMFKAHSNSGTPWYIYDNKRNSNNVVNKQISASEQGSEQTVSNNTLDFCSNGFKIRGTGGTSTNSSDGIIYMAFAADPMGGSGVAPATAR